MQTAWRNRLWLCMFLVVLVVGCGTPPDPTHATERTMEVYSSQDPGLAAAVTYTVQIHRGDIHVIAVDPPGTKAELIEELDMGDNIQEFAGSSNGQAIVAGGVYSDSERRVTAAHLRVPQKADVTLRTDFGNIYIGGNVGVISATASNGLIEVHGQTGPIKLLAHDRILIDGGSHSFTVKSLAGPITIMADGVSVDAQTDAGANNGAIFFDGELEGSSHFTATNKNDITLVVPQDFKYNFVAETSSNEISTQFPATAVDAGTPITVCGIVEPGPSILLKVERQAGVHGRVVVNRMAPVYTSTVIVSGTLTSNYYSFTTTIGNMYVTMPDPSVLHIDTGVSAQQLVRSPTEFEQPGSPVASGLVCRNPPSAMSSLWLYAWSKGGRIRIFHASPFATPTPP